MQSLPFPAFTDKTAALPSEIILETHSVITGFGFFTSINTVSRNVRKPDEAEINIFAFPSLLLSQRRSKFTSFSPFPGNATFFVLVPVTFTGPSAFTLTVTFFAAASETNTFTGKETLSPHESVRGKEGRSIKGDATVTVLSALP